MYPYECSVSFRISHPTIDPDEISTQLGLEPKISWRAGDVRQSPKGTPLEGRNETTYWSYALNCQPTSELIELLEDFTVRLESYREFLIHLRSTGGRLEYFVGWFSGPNSGEVFDHRLLGKIANLQIDLSFDIYTTSPEETKKLVNDVTSRLLSEL
jgi:hypothetical protein